MIVRKKFRPSTEATLNRWLEPFSPISSAATAWFVCYSVKPQVSQARSTEIYFGILCEYLPNNIANNRHRAATTLANSMSRC